MSTSGLETALHPAAWYATEEVAALLKVDAFSLRRWRTSRRRNGQQRWRGFWTKPCVTK